MERSRVKMGSQESLRQGRGAEKGILNCVHRPGARVPLVQGVGAGPFDKQILAGMIGPNTQVHAHVHGHTHAHTSVLA